MSGGSWVLLGVFFVVGLLFWGFFFVFVFREHSNGKYHISCMLVDLGGRRKLPKLFNPDFMAFKFHPPPPPPPAADATEVTT